MSDQRRMVGPGEYGYRPDVRASLVAQQPGDLCPDSIFGKFGVRGWILDLDGTFVPPYVDDYELDEADKQFLEKIINNPNLAAVIGTNREQGISSVQFPTDSPLSLLEVFYAGSHRKPDGEFFDPIFQWFKKHGIERHEIAVLGDGPAHDIFGAINVGVFSVQVARLDTHGYFSAFTDKDNGW